MAISNAEERMAVAGVTLPFLGPNVTPTKYKDAEWRTLVAGGYHASGYGEPFLQNAVCTALSMTGIGG